MSLMAIAAFFKLYPLPHIIGSSLRPLARYSKVGAAKNVNDYLKTTSLRPQSGMDPKV